MSRLVGQDVDRYHVVEQLGKGGMAYVYKAYDDRLDRNVALKVIIMNEQEDMTKFFKRFEREAKALAKLSHPNIVKIHDYGEYNGAPYLVMEYLEGGTLKLKLGKPIPHNEAARLLTPIAQALDYAHGLNIIHRDVKPANIMLTKTGLPMLTDFGIAKILEGKETTELTGTGVGIGTPDYMSPEQGQGVQVDFRTDIYSLGVVFYELVTGKKPFHADTPMATIIKHITGTLPRPKEYVNNLPDEVENVIFKAMAKNPENRYQTMGDFARALEILSQLKTIPSGETATQVLTESQATMTSPMPDTRTAPAQILSQMETVAAPPDSKATRVASQALIPPMNQVVYNYPNSPMQSSSGALPAAQPVSVVTGNIATQESGWKKFITHPVTRVLRRILTIILIFMASLSLVTCLVLTVAAVFAGNAIRDAVASSEFIQFEDQQAQYLTEVETEDILNTALEPYQMWIYHVNVNFQSPDTVLASADTSVGSYELLIEVITESDPPRFILKKINNMPLLVVGGILSNGINEGFQEALDNYNLHVDSLKITNARLEYVVSPVD